MASNMIDETQEVEAMDEQQIEGDVQNDSTWLRTNAPDEMLVATLPTPVFPQVEEVFRAIYTRVGAGFRAEVIAICSAIAGEGKTTVGVGMAVALAQDFPEQRVLLVETDLQRPVLAEDFNVEAAPGLVDCLVDRMPLLSACRPTFLDNLHIVPAGHADGVRGRPLRSSSMATLIETMRENYDIVILDLPAILVNSDAILLTDLVDGIVCVVRAGVTPTALVNRAVEQLEQSKFRGTVLNGTKTAVPGWVRRVTGI
jgi:capsular exopolysaccharide synthesis family protein